MAKQLESKIYKCSNKDEILKLRRLLFLWKKPKGYSDLEIEALFAKYDLDGDRCLNEEEQKNMLKELSAQNEELKNAYLELEKAEAERYDTMQWRY